MAGSFITCENKDSYSAETILKELVIQDSSGNLALRIASPAKVYLRTPPNFAATNYQVGDVGYYLQNQNFWVQEQGVIPVLDPLNIRLLDSSIPNNTNAFGNYERLTNDLGGNVVNGSDGSTPNYAIDHLTGKGYALRRSRTNQTWANAMNYAFSDPHGSYNDFRPVSAQECFELFDRNSGNLLLDLSTAVNFWVMNAVSPTNALFCRKNQVLWSSAMKFTSRITTSPSAHIGIAQVRNHY